MIALYKASFLFFGISMPIAFILLLVDRMKRTPPRSAPLSRNPNPRTPAEITRLSRIKMLFGAVAASCVLTLFLEPMAIASSQSAAKADASSAPVASASASPQQTVSQAQVKPTPPDYRPGYLAFRAKVHEPAEACSTAFRRMAGVLSGSKSEVDLYRAASEAKKVCREASWKFKQVDIPSSWPAQMRKDFKSVLEGMELAHIYKSEAAEAMMTYIDDKKVSNSAKFQEKADEANLMMTGAMAKMVVTAQSFGISTD
jgi:hypothetical protein